MHSNGRQGGTSNLQKLWQRRGEVEKKYLGGPACYVQLSGETSFIYPLISYNYGLNWIIIVSQCENEAITNFRDVAIIHRRLITSSVKTMESRLRYKDKIAIVTGGSKGIGEGIVREFGKKHSL